MNKTQLITLLVAVAAAGDAIAQTNMLPPSVAPWVLLATTAASAALGPLRTKKPDRRKPR